MPRRARKKSNSGIYHIMLRGINKQVVFEDAGDNIKFLQILKECKEKSGFQLYAYCLMENHVHILLKVEKEELEQIFRRIGASYVYWYNLKYNRSGHLFQDRYKSEPVENDSYFITVLRYIHQNPVKAGLSKKIDQYKWSSYNEYIKNKEVTDIEFALSLFSEDRNKAIELFTAHSAAINTDQCLDMEQKKPNIGDEDAKIIISEICGTKNATEFQKMNITDRDKAIKVLKENGLSIRQISRLTGISFGVVRKK